MAGGSTAGRQVQTTHCRNAFRLSPFSENPRIAFGDLKVSVMRLKSLRIARSYSPICRRRFLNRSSDRSGSNKGNVFITGRNDSRSRRACSK